jgi:hypothetical protein
MSILLFVQIPPDGWAISRKGLHWTRVAAGYRAWNQ